MKGGGKRRCDDRMEEGNCTVVENKRLTRKAAKEQGVSLSKFYDLEILPYYTIDLSNDAINVAIEDFKTFYNDNTTLFPEDKDLVNYDNLGKKEDLINIINNNNNDTTNEYKLKEKIAAIFILCRRFNYVYLYTKLHEKHVKQDGKDQAAELASMLADLFKKDSDSAQEIEDSSIMSVYTTDIPTILNKELKS
jgi:hypothetical protein